MNNSPTLVMHPKQLSILDYRYELPEDRIAIKPLPEREKSKLLVYRKGSILDSTFESLPDHLLAGDLLIGNQTRVIQARILFPKASGSVIEVMCLEPIGNMDPVVAFQQKRECTWWAMIGNAKRWKEPVLTKTLRIAGKEILLYVEKGEFNNGSFSVRFSWDADIAFSEILEVAGKIPLPPYLNREPDDDDLLRYQTVFAKDKGSVAAPTAGLHFTHRVLEQLKLKNIDFRFVTLHVGAGTFKPVKAVKMEGHDMHEERISVTLELLEALLKQLRSGKRVIAVGTTSLRTLESIYWMGCKVLSGNEFPSGEPVVEQWEAYEQTASSLPENIFAIRALCDWLQKRNKHVLVAYTRILIAPGYSFRIVNGLITNFHQPESTLLLLVAAFIGKDWEAVYDHALKTGYRFLSYGDSSLLFRTE